MGSATTICSDMTGTLTLNQMDVVDAYSCLKKVINSDGKPDLSPMVLSLIIEGIAQNTTDNVYEPEIGGDEEVTGSPTEKAILRWALKLGMNFEAARSQSSILHVFLFNSEKKRDIRFIRTLEAFGTAACKKDSCRIQHEEGSTHLEAYFFFVL